MTEEEKYSKQIEKLTTSSSVGTEGKLISSSVSIFFSRIFWMNLSCGDKQCSMVDNVYIQERLRFICSTRKSSK